MRVGYGRFEFRWDGIVGYRLMGCWSPLAAWWIDVVGWYSLLLDSFTSFPSFDFSLESELVFLAERSLLRSRMGFPYR